MCDKILFSERDNCLNIIFKTDEIKVEYKKKRLFGRGELRRVLSLKKNQFIVKYKENDNNNKDIFNSNKL